MNATIYRYSLHVDILATDIRMLRDALEDEPLSLRVRLGEEELRRQIDNFALRVDVQYAERWDDFERDIEILSTYLAAPIVGTEIIVQEGDEEPSGWRYFGRRGEVVRIGLDVVRLSEGWVDVLRANADELARHLPTMPRWAQSLLTPKLDHAARVT